MNATMDCESARDLMFDRRIGALPAAIVAEVDAHLTTCATCRASASRTISLLDGAAAAPAEVVSRIDPDALFARIEAELDAEFGGEPPQQPEWLAAGAVSFDDAPASASQVPVLGSVHRRRAGATWAAVGIAAGFLLGVGGTIALSRSGGRPDTDGGSPEQALAVSAGADVVDVARVAVGQRVGPVPMIVSLPHAERAPGLSGDLVEVADDVQSTRVFVASNAARYELGGTTEAVLDVAAGTVLVEFIPASADDRLHVTAPGLEADVVGTVFFVTTDGVRSELGVFVGGVRIAGGDRGETLLGAGTAMVDDGMVVPLSAGAYDAAATKIDLDAHRVAIEAAGVAFAASAAADEDSEADSTDPHTLEVLRARADEALRGGELSRAARLLESGVARLGPDHPWALTARLDLARIYSRRLDRPEAAMGHLRAFLAAAPTDVAAPRVRAELCALLGGVASSDPACASTR